MDTLHGAIARPLSDWLRSVKKIYCYYKTTKGNYERKSKLIKTNPALVLQNDYQTPLHIAVANEDQTLVDYFASCNAKSDIPDNVSFYFFI